MYNIIDVKKMMGKMAEEALKHKELLGELDGLSGDGDLGETVEKASKAVIDSIQKETPDIGALLKGAAMEINKAAPSTLGTLLSGGVMALAKAYKGKKELEAKEIAELPKIMADNIQEKGKAKPGDKTILDALCPMADAVNCNFTETGELKQAFHAGAKAAAKGAEKTKGMLPKAGRAQWIGERVKDNPDGGAVLCAKLGALFLLEGQD